MPEVVANNDLYTIEQDAVGNIFLNGFLVPPGGPTADQLAADLAQYCGAVEFYCEDLLTCTFWDDRCVDEQAREIQELLRGVLSINYGEAYYRILFGSLAEQLADAFASYGPGGGGFRGVGGIRGPGGSRNRGSCSSFEPGTLVLMADGTHKPIEDVQPGDLVLSTDPETGITGPQQVKDTMTGTGGKTMVRVTVVAGNYPSNTTAVSTLPVGNDGGAIFDIVVATNDHPFWSETETAWTNAGDLQPGDHLLTPNGFRAQVAVVSPHSAASAVHNLAVTNIHTYYVLAGVTPVLVHNQGGGPDPINFGNGYTGRVDQYVSRGGQTSFEIHVYRNGREYGFYGSSGWFSKHGLPVPTSAPQQLENTLKGHAVDFMRRSGQLSPSDNIKGDSWRRPRIEGGC